LEYKKQGGPHVFIDKVSGTKLDIDMCYQGPHVAIEKEKER